MEVEMKNGIKKLCGQTEISISDLARRIGMQPHTLRRYTRMREDGSQEAQPSIELATKIAKALDVSVEAAGAYVDKQEKERQEREAEYNRNNPTTTVIYQQSPPKIVGHDRTPVGH